VQIVWQAIDELRDVIDNALGSDAPDIWSVEPPQGPPPARYRPFAGYFERREGQDEDANGQAVELPPVWETGVKTRLLILNKP
jgi:hypothetical protein